MKRYTTLFLDLDNTLLDFYLSERVAVRRVLRRNGLPDDDATAALYSDINRQFWEAFERNEIPRERIFAGRFERLLEVLGFPGDAEKIAQDYFVCLSEGHDLIPGADELLKELQGRGYRLYATSNGLAVTQRRRMRDCGLLPYLDGVYISEDLGSQKPERAYFDRVMELTGESDRRAILVVGDSMTSDILGGINAGLDTCWYCPKPQKELYHPTYTVKNYDELLALL